MRRIRARVAGLTALLKRIASSLGPWGAARLHRSKVDSLRRALPLSLPVHSTPNKIGRMSSASSGVVETGRDVGLGIRLLGRNRGFALAASSTVALGIGANAGVFTIVDALLLRPLPYAAPERIVEITGPGQGFARFGRTVDVWPPALKESPAFAAVGLYIAGGLNLGGEPSVRVAGAAVTPSFFQVLGVTPALGRTFSEADVGTTGQVAVISDRLWRDRFAGDPSIVGRPLILDGSAFVILGVLPARVSLPAGALVWVPTNAPTGVKGQVPLPRIVARLNDAVGTSSVRDRVIAAASLRGPQASSVRILPLREALVGPVRSIAIALWAAAGLVLLIACLNSTNLLLARVAGRHQEFAVRHALGATRARLVRLVVGESLALSAVGAMMAIPIAYWTSAAGRVLLPATMHGVPDIALGLRTMWIVAGLCVVTTVLFGIGPAMSIRHGASMPVGSSKTAAGNRLWHRFRSILVVGEIAIAIVLLAGASALVQSVRGVMLVDLGATGERAITAELTLPRAKYRNADEHRRFWGQFCEALRTVPGVQEVGITSQLPGKPPGLRLVRSMDVQDGTQRGEKQQGAIVITASPRYFAASGIEVISGRTFAENDGASGDPVAIISEGFARSVGKSPADLLGARLAPGDERGNTVPETIVGVVRDVRLMGPDGPFEPAVYVPHAANPYTSGTVHIVVRSSGDPLALTSAIRARLAEIDKDLPLYNIETFAGMRSRLLAERRLAMIVVSIFAGLALTLAGIGMYGIISHLVQVRTREIGIRLAIGASRSGVCRSLLAEGAIHALVGIGLGILGALAIGRMMLATVPGLETVTPGVLIMLGGVVSGVALLATLIPAAKATRVDPALTLRAE